MHAVPHTLKPGCLMSWSCNSLQAHKCHERSSDLSECHVSLPAPAQRAQQDRIGSPDSERKATGTDRPPQSYASRRALAHSPSGKGSSSLDQIISDLRSSPADSDGNITLSAGTDTHSVGAVHSAGAVAHSVGGATIDSSQACSNVHLAHDGKATAMAQLAEAAAAICSEEKALKVQRAGQQHKRTVSFSVEVALQVSKTEELPGLRCMILSRALHAQPAGSFVAEAVCPCRR